MSRERILPEPHKYAVCAPDNIPIKEFYKGYFEEVFIFFHPFIKPKMKDYALFKPETFPSSNDIRDNCEMVTWEAFLTLSGIETFKQLDIGLRTSILGLKEKHQDINTANVIQKTCEEKRIVGPDEGLLPDFLINKLLKSIKKIGHEWIWLGDEFCTERKLEFIDDLIQDNSLMDNVKNLFTHDNTILVTTHWDSHFSLLCSDRATVKKVVESCKLEGFYCKEKTEIIWSVKTES